MPVYYDDNQVINAGSEGFQFNVTNSVYNSKMSCLKIQDNFLCNSIFRKILKMEEDYIEKICDELIQFKPDLVITEKGVSDLAQHFLVKAGISVIRRVRKSDNNRIAR